MTIDFSKPITTLDGRAVRILCTDRASEYPIVGLLEDNQTIEVWTSTGKRHPSGLNDNLSLINPPVKRRGWVAIYVNKGAIKVHTVVFNDDHTAQDNCPAASAIVQLPEWEGPA